MVEALMTPALRFAITHLRRADAAFQAAHPGEKPPQGNGLRLTAFQDYPESCTPEAVGDSGAVRLCQPAGIAGGVWRDRLKVVIGPDGTPMVSDILFAPDLTDCFSDWLKVATDDGG
jgi:hypothetical protein